MLKMGKHVMRRMNEKELVDGWVKYSTWLRSEARLAV